MQVNPGPPQKEYDSNNAFYPSKGAAFHLMTSGGARQGNKHGLDIASQDAYPGIPLKRRPIANFNLHRPSA